MFIYDTQIETKLAQVEAIEETTRISWEDHEYEPEQVFNLETPVSWKKTPHN